jgi:hypothetical protein
MKDEGESANAAGPQRRIRKSLFILHPSSFILHPSSFILHPSSFRPPPFPIDIDPRRRVLWPVESERRHVARFTGWLR